MTIEKRGDSYRVRVRHRGRPAQSATFPTLARAREWERSIEGERADARAGILPRKTVRDAIAEYVERECPKHKGRHWEEVRFGKFKRTLPFIDRQLATVASDEIARWRDGLMAHLKPSSAKREYGLLRAVFRKALLEWGWLRVSPFAAVTPPPPGQPRTQRITDAEAQAIIDELEAHGGASRIVAQAFKFALLTALRASEVLRVTREHCDVAGRILTVLPGKNDDGREVPMSLAVLELLKELPETGRLFPIAAGTRDTLFRRARDAVGGPIHFHDSRREALTRMAQKIKDPMLLAKISGHRDLKVLMNTYYRPSMTDVALLLD